MKYLVGLLGEGIGRSLTPAMHEAEAAELGLDYEYRFIDLLQTGEDPERTGEIVLELGRQGFSALNVTHPCKQRVMAVIDELSPEAKLLGAVNLVLFRGGRLIGHNTDWRGFQGAVLDGLPNAPRRRVVQLGAGGAGVATAYALLRLGVEELSIFDQDSERARAIASRFATSYPRASIVVLAAGAVQHALRDADGLVNATPVGMRHHPGMPIEIDELRPEAWVADIVYMPIDTALLQRAEALGHPVLDGGRMAVGQAVDSVRLITGRHPDAVRMRRHFLQLLAEQDLAAVDD
jgi:shikimate dehydrogenase